MKLLPNGWKAATIADTCDILDNKRKPLNSAQRLEMKGSVPYYGANGVVDYVNDYIFDEDLILMAEDGGNFSEYLTRPIAYQVRGKSWVNNHAHVLRAKPHFNQDYIFYSLEHKDIQPVLNGGTRAKLNKSELEKIELLLPASFEEQHKIAAILTAVDDKLDVIARQIEATQTLKQGLMQTLFSRGVGTQDAGGRWVPHTEFKACELGEIPTGWTTGELLNFLELQRGVDLPVQDRRTGEIPVFGSNGVLGFHDSSICNGPGVITGRSGTIGKVFYTETLYWPLNTSLYVKDFKGNHPKFVYYKLISIGLDKFSTGTGVPTLNRNVAHKEMVAFPSFNEQKEIARILTCLDEKISLLGRRADSTQSLKRGLMQKLLTGEWRVKVDADIAA